MSSFYSKCKRRGGGENDKCRKATLALRADAWCIAANGQWLRLIAAANAGRPQGEIVSVRHALLPILMKSNKFPKLVPRFRGVNEEKRT